MQFFPTSQVTKSHTQVSLTAQEQWVSGILFGPKNLDIHKSTEFVHFFVKSLNTMSLQMFSSRHFKCISFSLLLEYQM